MSTRNIEVRQPRPGPEEDSIRERLRATWGEVVARRGELVDPADGVLLAAYQNDELMGVVAYAVKDEDCEVVAIEALRPAPVWAPP